MRAVPAVPVTDSTARRSVALLLAGALLPLAAAGCTSGGDGSGEGVRGNGAALDVPQVDREDVASGGTLRWAVDEMPRTLNAFQPEAGTATDRVAGATLPALFTLDARGRPQLNADYLESAEVTASEPKQTVVYTLDPEAKWSGGRAIGAEDFQAQWKALRGGTHGKKGGRAGPYDAARNAGYDRIEKVTKGPEEHQVKVVFRKPYADWKSLFTPLYPKSVMGDPDHFADAARTGLPASAGPFRVKPIHRGDDTVTLVRNKDWWGDAAKLKRITLKAVPPGKRRAALEHGSLDMAEISSSTVRRIVDAHDDEAKLDGQGDAKAAKKDKAADRRLRSYSVRRALSPASTQLALNGADGPLSDERVRRAVARAIDRKDLAKQALDGTGLPDKPLGSHLRMLDQDGYSDNSSALGDRDVESAQSLLADAGWEIGPGLGAGDAKKGAAGEDKKPGDEGAAAGKDEAGKDKDAKRDEAAGRDKAAQKPARNVRTKAGKPLALNFVLPGGAGSEDIRATGERIAKALSDIGVRTKIQTVDDARYFSDHIASGNFDLALYAWPGTAYPSTDLRPVYAKPEAAADGSLIVTQNYTRVGTDQINQLFDKAAGTLDDDDRRDLIAKADARIWAAAGSVPLYQRPQRVAAKDKLVNAGAFGFQTPRYQDIGYQK